VKCSEPFGDITVIAEPVADSGEVQDSAHRPVLRNPHLHEVDAVQGPVSASAVTRGLIEAGRWRDQLPAPAWSLVELMGASTIPSFSGGG
jgi:hypothetical protein